MEKYLRAILVVMIGTAVVLTFSACTTPTESAEEDGLLAFVDDVVIKEQDEHYYVTVFGNYPDACSRVSDVQQSVEEKSINILLYVAKPAEMMCAQMLTPFEADILLTTGSLEPGEYTVTVNEALPTTLTIAE